jgi:hypothetical protein
MKERFLKDPKLPTINLLDKHSQYIDIEHLKESLKSWMADDYDKRQDADSRHMLRASVFKPIQQDILATVPMDRKEQLPHSVAQC